MSRALEAAGWGQLPGQSHRFYISLARPEPVSPMAALVLDIDHVHRLPSTASVLSADTTLEFGLPM